MPHINEDVFVKTLNGFAFVHEMNSYFVIVVSRR
jgi:hypothetical protein